MMTSAFEIKFEIEYLVPVILLVLVRVGPSRVVEMSCEISFFFETYSHDATYRLNLLRSERLRRRHSRIRGSLSNSDWAYCTLSSESPPLDHTFSHEKL